VEEQNPRFAGIDGVLFDKTENRILHYPAGKKEARYTIPAGVAAIGDYAFDGCESLMAITVEEQNPRFAGIDGVLVDKIENRILRYPAGKEEASYTIPAGVAAIGTGAFSGRGSLKTVYLSRKVSVPFFLHILPIKIIYTD
jgi:RNase P/RNase MRP subunit p29